VREIVRGIGGERLARQLQIDTIIMRKRLLVPVAMLVSAAITAAGTVGAKLLEHDHRDPVARCRPIAERYEPNACPPTIYACRGDVVRPRHGEGPSQAMALRFDAACGPVARGLRRAILRRDGIQLAAASGYRDSRKIPRDAVLVVPRDFACP
jgi:hypothetical protein